MSRTVGFAPGVFDMFHVGHVNLLRRASLRCDRLVVGVVSDDVAARKKGRRPVVPQHDRVEIVRSMRFVDDVVLEQSLDRVLTWRKVGFDAIFKGSDWAGTPAGAELERVFHPLGVEVVYLPYTDEVSTSRRRLLAPDGALPRAPLDTTA